MPVVVEPELAAATETDQSANLLNHSSYTDSSPFHQYLTQIENDYGVTSIESVGPNASITLDPPTTIVDEEEEAAAEVALASSYPSAQQPHQ